MKQINVKLSEKTLKKFDTIKETYDNQNTSEMMRLLIEKEYERIQKYKELIVD